MTLVDDTRGPAPAGSGGFDRTPPQDIDAEQSVLGAMMLSKDAIADVVEIVRPGDFYRPAHQLVYDAILDLYSRGEPADAVTVSAELTRTGQLARVGGASQLHTLISMVPTAANAGYYAAIVADRAILRRLVTAGTRIVQMGYDASAGGHDAPGTVDDVVDRAQSEVYEVTERRLAEDYVHIETLLQSTMDEIERISATGGIGTGIPTGFQELDNITNGLHPGQMITVAGRPGSGKALALDTLLPTPAGWTTMGAVAVGDVLLGADGRPTRVVAATDVMHNRPCFEVEFSDGTVITADAEHQWLTTARGAAGPAQPDSAAAGGGESDDRGATRPARRRSTSSGRVLIPASCRDQAARLAVHYAGEPDAPVSVRELVAELGEETRLAVQAEAWRVGTIGCEPRSATGARRSAMWTMPVYSRRALSAAVAERAGRPVDTAVLDARPAIVTTAELAASLHGSQVTHAVACAAPLALPEADLPLAPYALGAWLGAGTAGTPGSATITCADGQVVEQLRASGVDVARGGRALQFRLRGVAPTLRALDVLDDVHIPPSYLRASEAQRRALLRGLLDASGHPTKCGSVEFVTPSLRLAHGVRELVVGLGYRATLSDQPERWTVQFTTGDSVFGVTRKAERQVGTTHAGATSHFVVDVRPVPSVPVRCVQVDNDDHLYLAGPTMVPTHNSTLALDFARSAAVKSQRPTAIFSLEMGRLEIMMRLFSAEAGVRLQNMRSGHMNDQDWRRLALRSSELADAPLFIDDSPNLTMMEIRAKARRLKQRNDLSLVVIDYLQLMTSGKRVESRQQEVSEFSRAMKLLAKELEVPVVALSQLNRGPEQRTDKKPMLSDLRESGSIEQDSDMVLLVHRPDLYEAETERAGEADLIIAKHRNGPTATVPVAFQGQYSRFADMPS